MKFALDGIASAVAVLTEAQSGKLIKKVCAYVLGTDYVTNDATADAFFNLIKLGIDEEIKHQQAVSEKRRNSGKSGGQAKARNGLANASNCYQMQANASKGKKKCQLLPNASNCYQMDNKAQNAENQADMDKQMLANAKSDDIYIYNTNIDKDIHNDSISDDNILVLDNNMSSSAKIDLRKLLAFFNSKMLGKGIPTIKSISNKRKAAVLARFRQYGKQAIMEAICKASESDFLNGATDQVFVASFDWIFKPNNFVKVLEGNYDNRASAFTQEATSGAGKTIQTIIKIATDDGHSNISDTERIGDDRCAAIIDNL